MALALQQLPLRPLLQQPLLQRQTEVAELPPQPQQPLLLRLQVPRVLLRLPRAHLPRPLRRQALLLALLRQVPVFKHGALGP